MNRKALLIAVVSAALGLVLLVLYQERFKREAAGGQPVPVLVALQDIGLGEPLTQAKLGLRNIPEAYVDDRNIRRTDLQRVLGVHVSMGIRSGQAVLWTDLATNSDVRRDLSSLVRNGMRAVTIRADLTSNFGGLVRPGDRVDVLATMARGNTDAERVTLPLIQNLLVLAAGRDTGGEAAQARPGGQNNATEAVNQITLSATAQESELLVFAQDRGRLSLVLRSPQDIAINPDMRETTMDDILQPGGHVHAAPAAPSGPRPPQIEVIRSHSN